METIDTQLQHWAIAAGRHCVGSLPRQQLLTQIVSKASRSGKLWRAPGLHRDDYDEALQQTWFYVCRRIDTYDPDQAGVMTWINSYLKWRVKDIHIAHAQQQSQRVSMDGPDGDWIGQMADRLTPDPPPPLQADIHQWLHQEAATLQHIHIRQRPDIHCQSLIHHRLLLETPWKDLALAHGAPVSTLSNFFQIKCLPPLRQFIRAQGYAD
jgi:hypothetical protein